MSSLTMSFATSFLWEMFGEVREATSWNDILSTSTSGAPIAESFLQVGALMHRSKKTPLTVSAGWLLTSGMAKDLPLARDGRPTAIFSLEPKVLSVPAGAALGIGGTF